MDRPSPRHRQRGAVIVTVALVLLFLLGFMGLALDFGHLFVVKTELQTAADSCALAAAQELDGGPNALARATSAGKTAGNRNAANFQGTAAGITDADVSFSDSLGGVFTRTLAAPNAKYAKCETRRLGMAPWLLQALGAFGDNDALKNAQGVAAVGVATRASAQSTCAIPVQITPKPGGNAANNYGFTPGEWIPTLYEENKSEDLAPGHFGWANLDGSSSASETKAELLVGNGKCSLKTADTIGTSGVQQSVAAAWNTRFGLYKNGSGNPKIENAAPDLTGYAYTDKNWPGRSNAIGDFLARRATHRSYGDTTDTIKAGDNITGLNIKGGYKDSEMGTHAAGPNALATHGANRRLVMAPIVIGGRVATWACVLMLHPIDHSKATVYLEYVSDASKPSSPCTSTGLAGGTNGPLVSVLVQ